MAETSECISNFCEGEALLLNIEENDTTAQVRTESVHYQQSSPGNSFIPRMGDPTAFASFQNPMFEPRPIHPNCSLHTPVPPFQAAKPPSFQSIPLTRPQQLPASPFATILRCTLNPARSILDPDDSPPPPPPPAFAYHCYSEQKKTNMLSYENTPVERQAMYNSEDQHLRQPSPLSSLDEEFFTNHDVNEQSGADSGRMSFSFAIPGDFKSEQSSPSVFLASLEDAPYPASTVPTSTTTSSRRRSRRTVTKLESSMDAHLMGQLKVLMRRSEETQQKLQKWDERHGLPKSHSPTMVNSSRSRKQLQEGVILPKWDGTPLIKKNGVGELGKPKRRLSRAIERSTARRVEGRP